jgi:hypothetical protein
MRHRCSLHCPQCQQPAAIQRVCAACGYTYPGSPAISLWRVALGAALFMPVLLAAHVFLKYVFLPALFAIFSV